MKTALLIIDIQNDYFPEGKMELQGAVEAGLQAKKMLQFFRDNGSPVIHIQHLSTRPGSTFFIPDTAGAEIHEFVNPFENEKVIIKNYPNSFRDTELNEYLKENNITKLVICGMMTHMCIDATTRAAFDLGYECIVIGDACTTKDITFNNTTVAADQVHTAFLAALNFVYAKVLPLEEALLLLN